MAAPTIEISRGLDNMLHSARKRIKSGSDSATATALVAECIKSAKIEDRRKGNRDGKLTRYANRLLIDELRANRIKHSQ